MGVQPRLRERAARLGRCLLIFVLVGISCCYFFTGGGKNQASRFDLVRAIVDARSFRIDAYHDNTDDKAFFGDHYYCDKAPGTSLLAVPFVSATRLLSAHAWPPGPSPDAELLREARVATFFCATLPTAVTAVLLFLTALRLGRSTRAGALVAIAYALGTPAWAYGTLFWSSALAGACLVVAFVLALDARGSRGNAGIVRGVAIGVATGWAVVTEYTAVGAAAILVAFVLYREGQRGRAVLAWTAGAVAAGAAGPAVVLAIYDRIAFGSVLHLGYSSVVGWEGMDHGVFGVTYPKRDVLFWILFGREKGLFLLSPVLLLAPGGLLVWLRDREHRLEGAVTAAIFSYYLLVNASYHYWSGGWSYGPRHLGASLPFLCLGIAPVADGSRTERYLLGTGLALSVALTLMAMATHPMTPDGNVWPLRDIFWPAFVHGRLSLNHARYFSADQPTPSFNLGEKWGLRGLTSLAPLLAIWVMLAACWAVVAAWSRGATHDPGAAPPPS